MSTQAANRLPSKQLTQQRDYLAPDTSEIRLLVNGERGGLAHCTLPAGGVSLPKRHKTVEELWYVVAGEGEVWRSFEGKEEVLPVRAGSSLTIPLGASFQFRSSATSPLEILIATIPPWPGESEAMDVPGHWPTG